MRSDLDLARRAQKKDPDAFVELVHRYHHSVYRLAYRFGGSADRADDLCQECLVRAYEQIGRYDLSRPFLPWMMRVAYNVCINHSKGDTKRKKRETALHEASHMFSEQDLAQELQDSADKRRVLEVLEELSPETRILVVMRFVLGMSFREIAEQSGVKLSTVAYRVTRGLEEMRSVLSPEWGSIER